MKYEHRDYIALVAVTDTEGEKPRLLLSLNPSAFTPEEIHHHQIIVRNELKKRGNLATELYIPLAPGMYVAVMNVRMGTVSFTKFNMNMSPDLFREYKLEVQHKMETFFGMDPEPLLYITPGEATPDYVDQDR